jgi:hypothetical protein
LSGAAACQTWSGVPGSFCTSINARNWYERSHEWRRGRSIRRSRS